MVSTHEPKGSQFGERLDAVLRECGGNACQMSETELFQLFHERFNPPVECHPTLDFAALLDPENSILKHCWRSDIRGQGGQGFAMGHYYFKPLVLERPPTYTYPTIIQPLLDQPFGDYCITVKLRRVSADSMVAREQKELDRTNQLLSAKEDERAAVTRAKREERVRGLSQGDLVPIVLEFYVLAWDRTPQGLSHKVLSLESAIHAMQGAQIYSADLPTSATKYFFKSLPGPMADHLRGIELYAEDTWATDLLPISTTATGHLDCAHAMYLGASGAPVGVVTSTGKGRDSMILHSAWFGGSGMGKSVALNNFLHQTDPFVGQTIIIDNGLSLAPYALAWGQEPIIIRPGGNVTINFFDTRGNPLSPSKISHITHCALEMTGRPKDEEAAMVREALLSKYAARLCEDFADDRMRAMTHAERDKLARLALALYQAANGQDILLEQALSEFRRLEQARPEEADAQLQSFDRKSVQAFEAEHPNELRNLVFSFLRPDEHLTLSAFREFLELSGEGAEKESCELLATLLAQWCRGGSHGNLWDGASSVSFTGKRVVHFELSFIPESARSDKTLFSTVLVDDVWQHLVSLPREMVKQFVIDEASAFLDMPHGAQILLSLYERSRKLNLACISVWQQYGRIAQAALRSAIVGNSRAFFIFNVGDRNDLTALAHDIGLSSVAQDAVLKYTRPGQHPGRNFSEFCYFEPDSVNPICTTIRHYRLPEIASPASAPAQPPPP